MDRRSFLKNISLAAGLLLIPVRFTKEALVSRSSKILTGAKARIYMNGRLIGTFSSISYTTSPAEDVEVLDKLEVLDTKIKG